jgi:hypothetical protein
VYIMAQTTTAPAVIWPRWSDRSEVPAVAARRVTPTTS